MNIKDRMILSEYRRRKGDLLEIDSIVAEKLNHWRYLSHFRSVHRGQFFTEMKTTAPRKLLPESWGFLCCVFPFNRMI